MGKAAAYLVFALRAGLEQLQSLLDAVVDSLVIAGLEVQCVVMTIAAPVAAVKCSRTFKKDRGGYRLVVLLSEDDENVVGQRCADSQEEVQIVVGQ